MSKIGDIDQKLHVLSSSSMDDHLLKNHYHRRITIIWRERLFEAEPSRAISRFTRKSPNRSKLRPTLRICAPVYFVFVFQFVLAFDLFEALNIANEVPFCVIFHSARWYRRPEWNESPILVFWVSSGDHQRCDIDCMMTLDGWVISNH